MSKSKTLKRYLACLAALFIHANAYAQSGVMDRFPFLNTSEVLNLAYRGLDPENDPFDTIVLDKFINHGKVPNQSSWILYNKPWQQTVKEINEIPDKVAQDSQGEWGLPLRSPRYTIPSKNITIPIFDDDKQFRGSATNICRDKAVYERIAQAFVKLGKPVPVNIAKIVTANYQFPASNIYVVPAHVIRGIHFKNQRRLIFYDFKNDLALVQWDTEIQAQGCVAFSPDQSYFGLSITPEANLLGERIWFDFESSSSTSATASRQFSVMSYGQQNNAPGRELQKYLYLLFDAKPGFSGAAVTIGGMNSQGFWHEQLKALGTMKDVSLGLGIHAMGSENLSIAAVIPGASIIDALANYSQYKMDDSRVIFPDSIYYRDLKVHQMRSSVDPFIEMRDHSTYLSDHGTGGLRDNGTGGLRDNGSGGLRDNGDDGSAAKEYKNGIVDTRSNVMWFSLFDPKSNQRWNEGDALSGPFLNKRYWDSEAKLGIFAKDKDPGFYMTKSLTSESLYPKLFESQDLSLDLDSFQRRTATLKTSECTGTLALKHQITPDKYMQNDHAQMVPVSICEFDYPEQALKVFYAIILGKKEFLIFRLVMLPDKKYQNDKDIKLFTWSQALRVRESSASAPFFNLLMQSSGYGRKLLSLADALASKFVPEKNLPFNVTGDVQLSSNLDILASENLVPFSMNFHAGSSYAIYIGPKTGYSIRFSDKSGNYVISGPISRFDKSRNVHMESDDHTRTIRSIHNQGEAFSSSELLNEAQMNWIFSTINTLKNQTKLPTGS